MNTHPILCLVSIFIAFVVENILSKDFLQIPFKLK